MGKNCVFYVVYKNNRFNSVTSRRPGLNEKEYSCRPFYDKETDQDSGLVYTREGLKVDGLCITTVGIIYPYIPTLMVYEVGTSNLIAVENYKFSGQKATSNDVVFFVKRDQQYTFEDQASMVSNFTSNLNYLYYSDQKRLMVSPMFQSYGIIDAKRKQFGLSEYKPYILTLDHGKITVDPTEPYFDSGAGETGQWVDPRQSYKPFTLTLDHGQITIDPDEPRFDPGAGETGQWVDPSGPGFEYPIGYN